MQRHPVQRHLNPVPRAMLRYFAMRGEQGDLRGGLQREAVFPWRMGRADPDLSRQPRTTTDSRLPNSAEMRFAVWSSSA
jgi:hypothetical protein